MTSIIIKVNDNSIMNKLIYYDYKLKIGDYITDAAYTVVVENNKIKEIYDNNIDIKKQEELLKSNEFVRVKVRVEYKKDISVEELPTETDNLSLGFKMFSYCLKIFIAFTLYLLLLF